MDQTQSWFAGVDWASQKHDVWLADASGKRLGKQTFEHSGQGLAQMCDWLIATSGGKPEDIHVAIEVPHGPVVETLLDRGFKVYAINPKQLDRFRDRFSPSGAKDDNRDAETLSSSLRTDGRAFRQVTLASRPRGKSCPLCRERLQDFPRIRRTSKLLNLVQLIRGKFACEFLANGVRTCLGLY